MRDPPSPLFGNDMFFKYGLFSILGPFLGGSPMLKTVKNGSGIRVDPPPVFSKFPHFPIVFFWQRPLGATVRMGMMDMIADKMAEKVANMMANMDLEKVTNM